MSTTEENTYAAYQSAGELFGRLRDALEFGDLTMRVKTWGKSSPPKAFSYALLFALNGEQYEVVEIVSFKALTHLEDVEWLAAEVSGRWEHQHRMCAEKIQNSE